MDHGLVDLSLFDDFPAADRHFAIPHMPAFQRLYHEVSRAGTPRGVYIRNPRSCTMKPLPPLPRRTICAIRVDPRRGHGGSRCILSRIQRMRLDGHSPRPSHFTNTLQQRRNVNPIPQLTLSTPHSVPQPSVEEQTETAGRPACPMIWIPEEQIWMVVEEEDLAAYLPTEYYSPPPYERRQYAHSEPSPSLRPRSESSPIRTQFMTLMEPRHDDERLSPLFQEAINGLSMLEYGDSNEPPTFQVERDWRTDISRQQSSRRDSWHTASSGISAADPDPVANPRLSEWERWAIDFERPSSAR